MRNIYMKTAPVSLEDTSYGTTVVYLIHHWLEHHYMAVDCTYKNTFVFWIVTPFTGPTHLDFDLITYPDKVDFFF